MSIPAGFLSERYNDKKLLAVSFLVMMIASLDFVIFPGYVVFSVTLFCLGCCMAVLQVVINPMLRVAGGEEHFAFNSVLAQVGSLSGILCIGITGAAIVPFIIGWIGELTNLKTGMFFLLIPMGFVLSIGFWASPFVNNKTISLKKLNL
jgi:fucose permease